MQVIFGQISLRAEDSPFADEGRREAHLNIALRPIPEIYAAAIHHWREAPSSGAMPGPFGLAHRAGSGIDAIPRGSAMSMLVARFDHGAR
jgi:hypothetical protein